MRKVTEALLAGAYLCLALTIALLVWRGGAGMGVVLAALIGVLALAFSLHGMIGRGLERSGVRRELSALREANRILADQLEVIDERLAGFADSVQEDAERLSEELTTEVRIVEDLVQLMRDGLND